MDSDMKYYIAIDLKSFYASVECVERGLDPLDTNLVVADRSRTEKTICLAVSPSLKGYGIPGRARLFEVVQRVREVNAARRAAISDGEFIGRSSSYAELRGNAALAVDYLVAPPRMARYMEVSSEIYRIYMKYVSPEDIHVYSIDEVFIDVTGYLKLYHTSPHALAGTMIRDVLTSTGITATAGIGTNLYLAKIAMDIVAKHIPADADGVRIAELDESAYRRKLWNHRPLTDFWRVGRGYARKLEAHGMYTMGDVARCSLGRDGYYTEELLYELFGVNAELLIDHAWGWEPCQISDIKAYRPENNSISSGQVLKEPYTFDKGRLVVREMTDLLVLELVGKRLVTDQMVLTVGYDIDNLSDPVRRQSYKGPIEMDRYGRRVPKSAHGSINLGDFTSSTQAIMDAVTELYERIVDRNLTVRRMYVVANHVLDEQEASKQERYEQMELFMDYGVRQEERREESIRREKEKAIQQSVLSIKDKYGKNAILRGMNFEEGATARERNRQVGGHRA